MKSKRICGDPRRNYAREWRRWRQEHGLTQQQLASAIGLTRRAVIGIEGGKHRPSVTSRMKLKAMQQRYMEAKAWEARQ